MKIGKISVVLLVLMVILYLLCDSLIAMFGRKIVIEQIESKLKVKAELESVNLCPPFCIRFTNLTIGDFLRAEKILITPNPLGLFAGKIILSNLVVINPALNLEQFRDGSNNLPHPDFQGRQPPVFLLRLKLENGRIIFKDNKISEAGFITVVDRLNLDIAKNMLPPNSLKIRINLSMLLKDKTENMLGSANFSGWIDFRTKDMNAVFKLSDLEANYFTPYYGDFLSHRKLVSAKVNFDSGLIAKDNDLTAASHLRLFNLVYAKEENQGEGAPKLDLTKNALDFFTDKKGNLDLDFTLHTKFDNPQISAEQIKSIILEAAIKNLSQQSPAELMEKAGDFIEQMRDFGKKMKGLYKNKPKQD